MAEIDRVAADGVTEDEVARAKRQMEVGLINRFSTNHSLASRIGREIVAFGRDHAGEVLVVDYGGSIHKLVEQPPVADAPPFPTALSATGLFASIQDQTPAPGVVPYTINAEAWADGATAQRWIAVPGDGKIERFRRGHRFPANTVFAKTLSITGRRIETQVLHTDGTNWRGYSYRWNEDQTDAHLVGAAGANTTIPGPNGAPTPYRFASRAECATCHSFWAGYTLGFTTPQLDHAGADEKNQLETFRLAGYFPRAKPKTAETLADPYDQTEDLAQRVRAYLHVNCSHCHRRDAGGSAALTVAFPTPLDKAHLINETPTLGTFGIPNARVVKPGDPLRSTLYYRIATAGTGRMPRLGSATVDTRGAELIYQWIASLAGKPAARGPGLIAAVRSGDFTDALSTTPGALATQRELALGLIPKRVRTGLIDAGLKSQNPNAHGLFERFAPRTAIPGRLGMSPNTSTILALRGDVARGRALIETGRAAACLACHKIGGRGGPVGPDLSRIGTQYNAAQLLESILDPSKAIDPAYRNHLLQTADGGALFGVPVARTAEAITIRDAAGRTTAVPVKNIKQIIPQARSLMPDMLLKDYSAQEAADLIAYLRSLR